MMVATRPLAHVLPHLPLLGGLRGIGLGQSCPSGYFFDPYEQECLVQTQRLADPSGEVAWYEGIYGTSYQSGSTGTEQLNEGVRATLAREGISLDCREVCDELCQAAGMSPCCSTLCSANGGPYEHSAGAINRNPGVLMVELQGGLPIFSPSGSTQPMTEPMGPGETQVQGTTSAGGGGTSAPSTSASARVSNHSRPGNPLRVGDTFLVEVTGAPGQPVAVHAIQNGRDMGRSTYGSTDSSGRFRLTGNLSAEHAGSWSEVWYVGTVAAPGVSFTVGPAVSTSGPSGSAPPATTHGTLPGGGLLDFLGGGGGGAGGGGGTGLFSNPLLLIALAVGGYLVLKK